MSSPVTVFMIIFSTKVLNFFNPVEKLVITCCEDHSYQSSNELIVESGPRIDDLTVADSIGRHFMRGYIFESSSFIESAVQSSEIPRRKKYSSSRLLIWGEDRLPELFVRREGEGLRISFVIRGEW